jgi:hypothetical protein
MASRYRFFEKVWNDDIQHEQNGFLDVELIEQLKAQDFIIYTIPLAEQYRPDLIANKFYGNGKLYWVLVYVNDINDSPQGFEVNKRIKVPNPNIIGTLI